MEAENKLYADMYGDGQGQITTSQQQQQQQPNPSRGYTVYPSNMAEMPYYVPLSGDGYGGRYDAPPSAPLPPQQQMTVVGTNPQVLEVQRSVTCAILYSCLVTWICCFPIGLVAYMLASEYRLRWSNTLTFTYA